VTIAVAVKVFEGMVLAADSATTIALTDPAGNAAGHHVYNNANKLFHLHRAEPVAAFTWGLGSVGAVSISTIAKALRKRLMGKDPAFPGWQLAAGYIDIAGINRHEGFRWIDRKYYFDRELNPTEVDYD
jgi:hypothetical protein